MATIENVNDRTILQQFHSLYKAVEEIKNKGINLNVKGQYESETTYLKGDVVYNNGMAFYRINDGATTGIDTSNTEYWQMFFDAVSGLTGPRGPIGPDGADGWGFNNASFIDVLNDAISVDNNGINLSQTTRITAQQQQGSLPPQYATFEIETNSILPIVGSESIVVDVAEDGEHAEIHLDADITNKLAKTLITPMSTPTATEIVAVDTTNSQTMLAIGDGLSIENGTLKASSTGNKLYMHCLRLAGGTSSQWGVNIINSSSDLFTGDTFKNYLINNHKGYDQMLIVNGYCRNHVVWGTYYDETTQTTRVKYGWYTTAGVVGDESYNPGYINDYVIEL